MMWKLVVPVLAAVFTAGLGALVGGLRDIDVNDEGARNALNFAVVKHNRGTNDLYLSQVAEVVKVQSQVVAGTKYVITVRMGKTSCRKDSVNEVCAIHQDLAKARPYLCTFTVWSRPWINDISVLDEKCSV
ncbi:cystatin C (amyloid angiopathy and cerebral hemorrhage) [Thunnus thynnus]|uniref:cystatin C (amyloid angiopathy and cerebral hemorrhage) n=1 Tax=Thunnus maccoyii TaxID=8240 RepID=UPI001C4B308F|nr:cystatin C (amyloid angiopathy and cerebral hemorrhage) [Thunnus maccoyii]